MKARFSTHRNTLEARGAPKVPVAAAEGSASASWGQQDLSFPTVPAHGSFRRHHLRGCRSRGSSHLGVGVRPGSQSAGRKLALQGTGNFSGKAGEVGFVFGCFVLGSEQGERNTFGLQIPTPNVRAMCVHCCCSWEVDSEAHAQNLIPASVLLGQL